MKRFVCILTVMVVGIFFASPAVGDDVADVKSAVQALYDALSNGDAAGYARLILPGQTQFPRTGGLLNSTPRVSEAETKKLQGLFDAGLKFDVGLHHLDVKTYGNTAVATYYATGPATYPNGTVLQGTFRASLVWLKQAGQWKIVHQHISRLEIKPQ